MTNELRLRRVMLALLAPAGMFLGHWVAYLLAIPDVEVRAAVVEASGHPWWAHQAVTGPLVITLGASFVLLVRHLPHDLEGRRLRRGVCRWLTWRLAAMQMVGFVIFEVLERVAVGAPLAELWGLGILEHGVVAQLAVALLLTGAVWLLAVAAEHLRATPVSTWVPAVTTPILSVGPQAVTPNRDHVRPLGARAPPMIP